MFRYERASFGCGGRGVDWAVARAEPRPWWEGLDAGIGGELDLVEGCRSGALGDPIGNGDESKKGEEEDDECKDVAGSVGCWVSVG